MEFVRLRTAQDERFQKAMALYQSSFPPHEQRREAAQQAVLQNEAYHFNLICEDQALLGLMLFWQTDAFVYVEHFCIQPALRGQRLGQRALALLAQTEKAIVLEIDPPVEAVALRRKAFYERAGYHSNSFEHIHPPYHPGLQGHALQVMSYPRPISAAEYQQFNHYLKTQVMGQETAQDKTSFL